MTLNVTDFPFAWYLAAVQRKITERWEGRALQGRQPVVVFEISRNGQVGKLAIDKSSGQPVLRSAGAPCDKRGHPVPATAPRVLEAHAEHPTWLQFHPGSRLIA